MTNGIGRVGWRNFVPTNNPLWDNLLAYWSGDNTANDSKGTNNGTLVNGATYAAGKINNGFSFDGINDYVSFPNNSWNYTGDFSISFWIKPTNTSFGYVIENFNYTGYFYGWMVLSADNGIRFEPYVGTGSGGQYLSSGTYVNTGAWNHVAISRVGSTGTKIYINGVLRASDSNTINPVYHPTRNYSRFGAETIDGGANYYLYNGSLDEVGIWNKALTATEVTELYNAGNGKQYVAPTPAYTSRTTAFATATGITDTTILNALNTFDLGLISNGLDTKMKALYPFVGTTATTQKFNFMDARDLDVAFRLQFFGGGTFSNNGYQPNGTNAYADSFLFPITSLFQNNNHISFYSRTQNFSNGVDVGTGNGYEKMLDIEINWHGGRYYENNQDSYSSPVSGSFTTGLFLNSRIVSGSFKGYRNGTSEGTLSVSSTGLSNYSIFLGARNSFGAPAFFANRECAFASIGDGLTDGEASTFYSLVQAMQTSLSRAV